VLLAVFVVSAAVIWLAGIRLSRYTDVLAERLHLGAAIGGVILLAVATNLPEIAITVSAASSGAVGVAVGNLLGGIAIHDPDGGAGGARRRRPRRQFLRLGPDSIAVLVLYALPIAGLFGLA
jgi:cation:H+ antiporter